MKENTFKNVVAYISLLSHFSILVFLFYFRNKMHLDEVLILAAIVMPLTGLYMSIFVSVALKGEVNNKSNNRIGYASFIITLFILMVVPVAIISIIYLQAKGEITSFNTTVGIISGLESVLGVGIGMILHNFYIR